MLLTLSGRGRLSHPPNRSTIQSKKTPDLYTEEEEEEEETTFEVVAVMQRRIKLYYLRPWVMVPKLGNEECGFFLFFFFHRRFLFHLLIVCIYIYHLL